MNRATYAGSAYPIGAEVRFHGDPYRITSEPYPLHGGWFQDAIGIEGAEGSMAGGRTIVVPTPQAS